MNPLRRWRLAHHVSRRQIADWCHVHYQSVKWWEDGVRTPKPDNFASLKHYTGITPEEWQQWAASSSRRAL